MLKQYFRIFTIIFIITLGITLGAGLFAGIVVAPTIFNSEVLLGSALLTRFQEGLLMTQVFERLAYLVNFLVVIAILYEVIKFKAFENTRWTMLFTFLVAASGLLFTSYYIPQILEMQALGEAATMGEKFENVHKGSELNFKLFAFSTLALLISTLRKVLR
ncbi:MAG: Membrane protein [uncultured Sulfurovum sp.]|uniref:Membrane protein n=1 Tax=uncultured Sulfurovum sp. TaxID=269237 RepID=A0A6S6TXA8_9BACT|nr:MAG: Membrane protein [uncultured Sulfurovum sp.]